MVCCQVYGNDAAISMGGSQGNFELNVYRPMVIYNLLMSIRLLGDGMRNFNEKCAVGIEPHTKNIKRNLDNSLMLATVLNTEIGYDQAAKIVKKAHNEDTTLKEAAVALDLLTAERFDEVVDPKRMIGA